MDILNSRWVRTIIIIVVVCVAFWLGGMVLEKIGGHFNLGLGVGNAGFGFNIGQAK